MPEPHLVTPYGSVLVLQNSKDISDSKHIEIVKAVVEIFKEKLGESIGEIENFPEQFFYEIRIQGFSYIVNEECSWSSVNKNRLHELVLISVSANFVAIYTSNTAHRAFILNSLVQNKTLQVLRKIPSAELIKAFLTTSQLKAIWMSGTHKVVDVKADSKVLSGRNLECALDPLADSTYLASAARVKDMGVALRSSVVWTRSHENLDEFANGLDKIFESLRANAKSHGQLPVLASELSDFNGVSGVFDFEVGPPEAFSGRRIEKAENLISLFNFETAPCSHQNSCCFHLKIQHRGSTRAAIQIHLEPKFQKHSTDVFFQMTAAPPVANSLYIPILDALADFPELFRVFYESGHTISAGALAISNTKDQNFSSWRWANFTRNNGRLSIAVDIKKEKPDANNLSLIWSNPNEDSLFTWLVSTVSTAQGANTLGLKPLSNSSDVWLFCDDDAGEIADFVHLYYPANPSATNQVKVTLIHIKGAKSSSIRRQMVAGPFEVVCGQAIKNARYIDRSILVERIQDRIFDPDRPLWNDPLQTNSPPQGDRFDFYSLLMCLPADTKYEVLIVQPHVTQRATQLPANMPGATPQSLGAVQLRSLLFSTQASARAVTADFWVVGCA
ncbi:hypothetical protein [Bdellovibrio reynosensis]|uniref:Uncharacterized protein n=1 Tax=Bdellovibrio reynosensis TaxID=2835041 RepID=A0ABY4CD47_9BACT|nr:hypothetical protein [Bdellovibrio reynosensis]UOF02888.1 hypothetical protein MNR06_07970 [Bdellovibrio reynosensis]